MRSTPALAYVGRRTRTFGEDVKRRVLKETLRKSGIKSGGTAKTKALRRAVKLLK